MKYLNYMRMLMLTSMLVVTIGCEDDKNNEGNHLPTVGIISSDKSVDVGEKVDLTATAIDVDGDSLTYLWDIKTKPVSSVAVLTNAQSKKVSFVPDKVGEYVLTFKANDGLTDSKVSEVTINAMKNESLPTVLKEDCLSHDVDSLYVMKDSTHWTITDGRSLMFAFDDKYEADRSLDVIKHYKMDESCFVGRPNPNFSYMLVNGESPKNRMIDEDCIGFDLDAIEVKKINNSYKIVDGGNWLFDFEDKKDEADKSFAIIKKYGFTETCYVGRPNADFSYLRKDVEEGLSTESNMIAKYQLSENGVDTLSKSGNMILENTEFRNNALYLNGLYHYDEDNGYKASTAKLDMDYSALSVSFSFNAIAFDKYEARYPHRRVTLLAGGAGARWLLIEKDFTKDNINVSFNNYRQKFTFENVGLTTGEWHKLAFSFNVSEKKLLLLLDGRLLGEKSLPSDFVIDVAERSSSESNKHLMFTNYSNGNVFYGYIKELNIANKFLDETELKEL